METTNTDPVDASGVTYPYQNPIQAKMLGYAEALRNLVNAAYAEGIVLSTAEPKHNDLPLPDDQGIYRVICGVPMMGHTHLVLNQPVSVMAEALTVRGEAELPLSIVPAIELPKPESFFERKKLIPVRRPESEWCFVSAEDIQPWAENDLPTSALRFDTKFDLLGLSTTEDAALTDYLDPGIALESVYYRDAALNVQKIETLRLPFAMFCASVQGNYRDMELQIGLSRNEQGGWYTSGSTDSDIQIAGKINLQFGNVEITAISNKPGIVPLGFTLDAYRSNPNRQGA